jgi:hypothetical protein
MEKQMPSKQQLLASCRLPDPAGNYVSVVRPDRDRDDLADELKMVMHAVKSDIDDGASGRIMVDKDFNPTGKPAPDPIGAYGLSCNQRIWEHDGTTAFLVHVELMTDGTADAGCRACCPKCSQRDDAELAQLMI